MHRESPKRSTPWNTLSARVISIVSRKGGVGKTTSTVNLGAALALSGHSVLIIGVDPQCGVSRTLGYGIADLDSGLLDLFERNVPLTHLAHTTPLKDLFVISPRIATLDDEEKYLAFMRDRADHFAAEVDRARHLYDTILIDCPPSLSPATRAALQASDTYLVPVQAEELCRDSLGTLIATVDSFRDQIFGARSASDGLAETDDFDRPAEIEGIFLTMTNDRTRMSRHVAARVADEFGPVLFRTAVPRTTRLSEMALRGKPAVIYDRRSAGSRAYFDLADELVSRYRERDGFVSPVVDAEDEPRETAPCHAAPRASSGGALGGLDQLLRELKANGQLRPPLAPAPEELEEADVLSLDDLLAEEEREEKGREWDDAWETGGRVN